jgi:hypothetical protein
MRYDERMKSIPDPDTTPEEKMAAFHKGLRQVLNCSKEQLNNALEYEKRQNEGKPKRGPKPRVSSARASRARS